MAWRFSWSIDAALEDRDECGAARGAFIHAVAKAAAIYSGRGEAR